MTGPYILGVDPGAVHVGVSEWDGMRCTSSYEVTPEQFAEWVSGPWLGRFDRFCAEAYVPQGGFGNASTGVDTMKLLGYYEHSVRLRTTTEVVLTTRLDRMGALKRLQAVGYPFHDKSGHARDAEAVVVSAMRWSVRDVLGANA